MTLLSPLQLKAHRFTQLHLEAVTQGVPGAPVDLENKLTWGRLANSPNEWRVELHVSFAPSETQPGPYKGSADVIGFFEVAESWPEENRETLVTVNGASLLYGAIREMILTMSARCSHGEFLLPTLRFSPQEQVSAPKTTKKKPTKKRTT
jgi:preprotein translocase subunit SecB